MNEWERELEVDPLLLRAAANPAREWRLLASGWDCDAWLADESVVWRVPRRTVAIRALEHEAWLMPLLAPRLPVAVPVPELVHADGLPTLARHALVPGRELAMCAPAGPVLAEALGRCLRAPHGPARVAEVGGRLRVDPMGRGDYARRVPVIEKRLSQIAAFVDTAPLMKIVEAAAGPPLAATAVCHGDLHIRHVMVGEDGNLSGLIDWGDSCLAAPALDLAIVTSFTPATRDAFFAAYGEVGAVVWRHARMLGIMFGASLLAADPDGEAGASALRWLMTLAQGE